MNPGWLKQSLPRGLYGRALLILIVPIATIQLVVSIMFIQRHFEDVTRQMTGTVLMELRYLQASVGRAPSLEAAQAQVAPLLAPLAMDVTLPVAGPRLTDARNFYDLSGRAVVTVLRDGLPGLLAVDLATHDKRVLAELETRWGIMRVDFDRRRVSATNPHQLLVLMVFTSLLMTLIAYLFLRNQLRPIRELAQAAAEFGRGRSVPYRPGGALEVRAAGSAFLDMRARIERQIEQRTLMLSGVSHDLRTPLTRLKLGLAMAAEDAETAAMRRDVEDMERLLDAFLAFSRGDADDVPAPCDPATLVRGIVDNALRAGQNVAMGDVEGSGTIALRETAVRRAVENLVNNAVRYGSRARVSSALTERALRITVEDDGPGIPRAQRDDALKPFVRLDESRNQDKGSGVGLGLTIAMDVARSHGGMLRLGESDALGGLKAELVLSR